MGSHPTLDQQDPAAEAHEFDPDDWIHGHHRSAERTSEQAFDRLNPEFGCPPTALTASATATSPNARPP
jgi:hypothetical protein